MPKATEPISELCPYPSLSVIHSLVGLWPFACWDRGFEFHRGHGRLSVVNVVCCQVEVSVTSWPLVRGSPTDCGASLCVTSKPHE